MKLALFGASGNIGQRILREALQRGHSVTALGRDPSKITQKGVTVVRADATDAAAVASAILGHDAVISAISPSGEAGASNAIIRATNALLEGLKRAKVRRLIVVGGAGSLEVKPGVQLVDTPEFPPAWKGVALAHRDSFQILKGEKELDWTYFSPAAFIEAGLRTGKFRLGTNQLVVDASGKSAISMEDYAVALLNELEKPQFIRKQFTAAY